MNEVVYSRRQMLVLLAALSSGAALPSTANAQGIQVILSKRKIGSKYRVKIWLKGTLAVISIPKTYMGQFYVPVGGSASKTLGSLNAAPGILLSIAGKHLTNINKVNVRIVAKTHGAAQTIIKNI